MTLARKYRPKSFDDLVGQEAVSITLSQALANNRLSHAYLFSGLRGSGKTSTARIFAKALLCESGPTPKPCEECSHCVMANENRHIDIIEMDGASNRGIDDIKELIEHTKYKPSSGRFKIFIIDEVHMLTIQAFNALLKTLEEPPEFVKFILATTDPLKLPATILSRVQHFRFKKIPQKIIQSHLEHILNLEKIEYEKQAVSIIARVGAGSLRDALTLLDQAIVYAKSQVDTATVTKMLGVIEPSILDELLDAILHKDRDKIIEFIDRSLEYEAQMVIDELTLYAKELLLNRDFRFSPLILDRFFRILAGAKELLHIGSDGEFVLSLTLFKMIEAMELKEIDSMIENLESELLGKSSNSKESLSKNLNSPSLAPTTKSQINTTPSPQQTSSPKKDRFQVLIDKIYDRDYELGEVFEKNIEFVSFENSTLTWKSKAIGDDKESLKNHWAIIRTFVQEVFGIDTKIVNLQDDSIKKIPKEKSISKEDSQKEINSSEYDTLLSSSCVNPDTSSPIQENQDDILKEPMVKKAIELFNPKRVRIKNKI